MKLRWAILATSGIWALGCSTAPSSAPSLASTEGELNADCTYPRRYLAILREGACAELPAGRGKWVPSPLFDEAPGLTGACFYAWEGPWWAPVDRDALRRDVIYPGFLTPWCGLDEIDEVVELVEVPNFSPSGRAGAVGCDVCGIQIDGNVSVVLPPGQLLFREVQVKLSNGLARTFKLEGVGEGPSRLKFALPPAPAGASYVNGPVRLQ